MRWYGHVLRQPEEDILMQAMVHKVDGKHKQGQWRMKWGKVEGQMRKIGLKKEDVADQCSWREGVGRVAEVVKCMWSPSFTKEI